MISSLGWHIRPKSSRSARARTRHRAVEVMHDCLPTATALQQRWGDFGTSHGQLFRNATAIS
jgi:hypothetical protein